MSALPPFARALKTRRPGAEKPAPSRPTPDVETRPRDYESDSVSPYPQYDRPETQPKEQDYIDEIQDLRSVIQDLEQQVSDLTAENRRLQQSQLELETNKQMATELQKQIEELSQQLRDEILKNKCLSEQVEQLENLLESKRQLTDAKEQMVRRMQNEYHQVMGDYQRLLEVNSEQAGQLRQARVDISELDAQVAQLRSASRRVDPVLPFERHRSPLDDFMTPSEPPRVSFERSAFPPPMPHEDDRPPFDSRFDPPPNDRPSFDSRFDPPPNDRPSFDSRFDPPPNERNKPEMEPAPVTPTVTSHQSPKKSALVDNIRFGEDTGPAVEVEDDTETMTVPEMKQHLEMLRQQKEDLERKLNKAPAKGRLMAHVRREQEENEAELEVVTKKMSRLRFALRKLHAL